jgi:hypothetical protein
LPKRGNSSLWKREVGRDFTNQNRYYFEAVNNYTVPENPYPPSNLPLEGGGT